MNMESNNDMNKLQKFNRGLQILIEQGAEDICAEHDMFYCGPDPNSVSSEIKAELEQLGWHCDEFSESFYFFT